jgi:hypothetical protein
MDRTIDAPSDRPTASPGRSCPLCGEQVQESQYPRHRITLEDESDTAPNQLVNGRVCGDCWDNLYTDLAAAD